jgi:predicted RNA-binding Zn ribbon-like protein
MKRVLPVIEAHAFQPRDFVGGDAALDFVNTVTGRDQAPRDWLDGYERLLEWARLSGLLPAPVLGRLAREARRHPARAAKALARAKALRESLFALLSAIAAGDAPPRDALARLREHWIAGVAVHDLQFGHGHVAPRLREGAAGLDLVAAMIAYRLVENVLPLPPDRLRMCAGPNCAWLFVDGSKAARRRWCDMAVCGNAAKSRRFLARARRRRAS